MAGECSGIRARTATAPTATRWRASIWAAGCSAARRRIRISCRSSATAFPAPRCPPATLPTRRRSQVVAYLRSVAASGRSASGLGVVDRGRAVFDGKGACATCHRVNGSGARLGPDLSSIGQLRRAVELEASVVNPSAEMLGDQPHLSRRRQGRHDDDGTAAEPGQLHGADARHAKSSCGRSRSRSCATTGSSTSRRCRRTRTS